MNLSDECFDRFSGLKVEPFVSPVKKEAVPATMPVVNNNNLLVEAHTTVLAWGIQGWPQVCGASVNVIADEVLDFVRGGADICAGV